MPKHLVLLTLIATLLILSSTLGSDKPTAITFDTSLTSSTISDKHNFSLYQITSETTSAMLLLHYGTSSSVISRAKRVISFPGDDPVIPAENSNQESYLSKTIENVDHDLIWISLAVIGYFTFRHRVILFRILRSFPLHGHRLWLSRVVEEIREYRASARVGATAPLPIPLDVVYTEGNRDCVVTIEETSDDEFFDAEA